MGTVELTFNVEHADLYRDQNEKLVAHLVGFDYVDLLNKLTVFKAEQDALAAAEAAPQTPTAIGVTG